jgi:hypothetical protein
LKWAFATTLDTTILLLKFSTSEWKLYKKWRKCLQRNDFSTIVCINQSFSYIFWRDFIHICTYLIIRKE